MPDPQATLAGPRQLVVAVASAWGPLAGLRRCALPPMRFAIVNTGPDPASLTARLDPSSAVDTGESCDADLAVRTDPAPLPEQSATTLLLSGAITARPGSYETTLRLAPADGPELAIPVRVDVSAGLGWAIGLLLLGLLTLGLVNILSGETALRQTTAEALAAEGALYAAIAAHPLSSAQTATAAAIERDFQAAIAALDAARPFSIVDDRLSRAAAPLARARDGAATLQRALQDEQPGAADIDEFASRWDAAKAAMALLRTLIIVPPASQTPSAELPAALDRFLGRDEERLLLQPMAFVSDQTVSHLARARLDLVAGEGAQARAEAANASLWLGRATAQLAASFERFRLLLATAGSMGNEADAIRRDAAAPDLDPPARDAILAKLDGAAAHLDAGPWPDGLVEANGSIDQAALLLAHARGAADGKAFDAVSSAAFASTDLDDMERFAAGLAQAPNDPASRQAARFRILALWQAHVATVSDPPTRKALQQRLDAMGSALRQGRLKDFAAALVPLDDAWSAWRSDLIARTEAAWAVPVCRRTLAETERLRAAIEARLREAPALDPDGEQDRALNRLALDARDADPDPRASAPSCPARANRAYREAIDLSGALTATSLHDSALSPAAESRLMAEIGVPEVAGTPRVLRLVIVTRPADRVVGNPITVVPGGFDPAWGRGVGIEIGFGDGSPALRTDAEALRHGLPVTHTYAAPVAPVVTMTAVRGAPGMAAPPLGRGTADIRIVRSRAHTVEALAQLILNLRFALALLIASVVYVWRARSRTAVFGAHGFDYIEAFALGFAADAATSELPGILAKLVSL